MNQSTGPRDRSEFQGVNGVMLTNEHVGSMALTFFVDLKNTVIFVILEGGMESAYFHYREELTYIENIGLIGVRLEEYVSAIEMVSETAQPSIEGREADSPLPPYSQIRSTLLTRAREERAMNTN